MDYFNDSHVDRFEDLFLKKVNDVKLRYDNVARLDSNTCKMSFSRFKKH
jgi:hypothetical protein